MAKISSIKRKKAIPEKFYNLAVEVDESYIANGIVAHNCRSLLIPITMYEEFKPDEKIGRQNIDSFIEEKKGKGFPKQ